MRFHKPYQRDNNALSRAAATNAGASESNPDRARPEYRNDTDLNFILHRFNATGEIAGIDQRKPTFTVRDYDIDLTTAFQSINEVKAAHANLPDNLKGRYKTWPDLMNALANGELELDLSEAPPETPAVAPPNQ